MCAACEQGKSPMDLVNTVRDGIDKEVDARIRAQALQFALGSIKDYRTDGSTREVVKRAVVFMQFLNGDIASREQVPE